MIIMRFFCMIVCVVLVCAQKNKKIDSNIDNKIDKTNPQSGNTTQLQCGKNEVQNDCPKYGYTDPDCESLLSGFKKNCPPAPTDYKCTPRCDCKKDFVRIDKDCVSPDRCCVGKNEEITDCPAECDDTCVEGEPLPGCKLTPCFNKGCKCKKNFVRFNSTCIERKNCPDKIERPKLEKKLEACNAKKKQATVDAVKKAAKAKIVTSKNFTKRSDDDAKTNATFVPIDLPKFTGNITLPSKLWARKTGLLGKSPPTPPAEGQNSPQPAPSQSVPSQPARSQPDPSLPTPSVLGLLKPALSNLIPSQQTPPVLSPLKPIKTA